MKKSTDKTLEMITLREILENYIEEILDHFGIHLQEIQNRRSGPCPIHGGDNYRAFSIYSSGIWRCFTKNCHEDYGKDIVGLLRGLLSIDKGSRATNKDIFDFAQNHLEIDINNMNVDETLLDKKMFSSFQKPIQAKTGNVSRESIRKRLIIPAEYYIKRGHSPLVLNEFDVGLCLEKNKEFFNRIVVPIYDENNKYIGASARTQEPECTSCGLFHKGECPKPHKRYNKWIHSKGFYTGNILYNFWKAREHIENKGIIILVEGPADVWKVWEAGHKNVVGMFTCTLTDHQISLLQTLSVHTILTMTDADEAGVRGFTLIKEKLSNLYGVEKVNISEGKDPGDLSIGEINSIL